MSAAQDISIVEYLKKQITVEMYFDIVFQLVTSLEKMQKDGLQMVLDFNQMHVNNGKLKSNIKMEDAIYETATVRDFIKDMTFRCIFSPDQQCEEIGNFLRTIDTVSEVYFYNVVFDFCREQLHLNQQAPETPSVTHVPQMNIRGGNNGETGVLSDDFWKDLERKNQASSVSNQQRQMPPQSQSVGQRQNYQQSAYASADSSNGETGVLDPSFWQQISQGNSGQLRPATPSARLTHTKSGVVVPISSDEFWIGKGNVDLKIDKDVISRKHAKIVRQQNHFFVIDNGSTNKTFVDGKEIPAQASIEIFKGTHIKFANDEYVFEY